MQRRSTGADGGPCLVHPCRAGAVTTQAFRARNGSDKSCVCEEPTSTAHCKITSSKVAQNLPVHGDLIFFVKILAVSVVSIRSQVINQTMQRCLAGKWKQSSAT